LFACDTSLTEYHSSEKKAVLKVRVRECVASGGIVGHKFCCPDNNLVEGMQFIILQNKKLSCCKKRWIFALFRSQL